MSYECHTNVDFQYVCPTRTDHLRGVFEPNNLLIHMVVCVKKNYVIKGIKEKIFEIIMYRLMVLCIKLN